MYVSTALGVAVSTNEPRRHVAERAHAEERAALLLHAAAEREQQLAAELHARTQAAAALEAELVQQLQRPALDDLQVGAIL
jgi:hypothetical protein